MSLHFEIFLQEMKRQTIASEKIIANFTSNKSQYTEYIKNSKTTSKKIQTVQSENRQMTQTYISRQFIRWHKDGTNHMKRCPTSFDVRET